MLCYVFSVDDSLFFCFKQKTAYEMRISDWSSDECSSDLWRAGNPTLAWHAVTRDNRNYDNPPHVLPMTEDSSITHRAYIEIRAALISCRLAPSSRLNIAQLQREIGVSQAAVREALSRLTAQGLATIERNSEIGRETVCTPVTNAQH